MNNARRQRIIAIKARIADLKTIAEAIHNDVETIMDDEQEYRDNMPDSLADGEKGEKADAAIDALDQVLQDLGGIEDIDFDEQLDIAAE